MDRRRARTRPSAGKGPAAVKAAAALSQVYEVAVGAKKDIANDVAQVGAKVKAGVVLGLTAQSLFAAIFIAGMGLVSYGLWQHLGASLGTVTAAYVVGGILLVCVISPALFLALRAAGVTGSRTSGRPRRPSPG